MGNRAFEINPNPQKESIKMNTTPFTRLSFGTWSFASAGSFVEVDGKCFSLDWQEAGAGSYTAQTPAGQWHLRINSSNGKTVLSTSIQLDTPVKHLKYVMLECRNLPLEHLVYTGMKMGRCGIVQAPVAEKVEFDSFYNCILSDLENSLMLSHPLKQPQMAKFCGTASGNSLDLSVIHLIDHFDGTEIALADTVFECGSPFEMLAAYSSSNIEVKKEIPVPESGWNSWDYYRWTVTEEAVLKNAEFIARDPILSQHVKRIIVDDGWQYCYGEWHANSNFPSGTKYLANEIRKLGFTPGIWVAPAIVEPHARIAQLEYDMLGCSEGGQPCIAFQCMCRYGFILDPTVEKSRKFLRELFDRLVRDGFSYFKLDFLAAVLEAAQFSDKSVPRSRIIRHLMQPVCDGVAGRAVILGCNYPFMAGNKYVDAARVGSDIHAAWGGIVVNAVNVACRYWMNKNLWINDPDFALCRGVETSDYKETLQPQLISCRAQSQYNDSYSRTYASATENELKVLLSIVLMSGGAINLSDDLTKLNEIGLDLARKAVSAVPGDAAIPLDLFSNKMPSRWLQKLPHGGRYLVVNFEDSFSEFVINCPEIPAQATDFWSGKRITVPPTLALAPHSCLLLEW